TAAIIVLGLGPVLFVVFHFASAPPQPAATGTKVEYQPRQPIETSGWLAVYDNRAPLAADASLEECAKAYREHVPRCVAALDDMLATNSQPYHKVLMTRAALLHAQGDPRGAYKALEELEA